MDNNKFHINVVTEIPEDMTPGVIYVNGTKYINKIPEGNLIKDRYGYKTQAGVSDLVQENKRFLLVGSVKSPTDYLGLGVDKEVVACVSEDFRIDSNKIFITPHHPGFSIPEPQEPTRYYLDSENYILYQPVENPRVNGYKRLQYLREQAVVYQESLTSPIIYVYADYQETEEVEGVLVYYDTLSTDSDDDEHATYLPINVIIVHSEEELHNLTPSFMGIYKVVHDDGTFTAYIYNPYNVISQEYFNFNCDVFY